MINLILILLHLMEVRRVNKAIKALKKMKFEKRITFVHDCIEYLEGYKKDIQGGGKNGKL